MTDLCDVRWDGSAACHIKLYLNPVPASRPRVTRWGVYHAKTYKRWLIDAQEAIPQALRAFDGPVNVRIDAHVKKPRTSKLYSPRGDVDNYAKGPLDVLTKLGYWGDDAQVVKLTITKQFARSDGMVDIWIRSASIA